MSKPMECPFCGEVNSYYEVNEWRTRCYITCYSCYASGPRVEVKRGANAKAASLWRKAVKR